MTEKTTDSLQDFSSAMKQCLTQEAADSATDYIRIPMGGQLESLNAAVAAAVLMYERIAREENNCKLLSFVRKNSENSDLLTYQMSIVLNNEE